MPKPTKLPANKEKRKELLLKMYLDLHYLRADSARWDEIIRLTGGKVSVRTLKEYKKEDNWAEKLKKYISEKEAGKSVDVRTSSKKVSDEEVGEVEPYKRRQPAIVEETQLIELSALDHEHIRTRHERRYTSEQKEELVKQICLEYEQGFDLVQICESKKISLYNFQTWINENEYFQQLFLNSKITHEVNFTISFYEGLKNRVLNQIRAPYRKETIRYFKISTKYNEDGSSEEVMIYTHGAEKIIPNVIDSKQYEMFKDLVKTMQVQIERSKSINVQEISKASSEELYRKLQEIEKMLVEE